MKLGGNVPPRVVRQQAARFIEQLADQGSNPTAQQVQALFGAYAVLCNKLATLIGQLDL